MTAGAAGRAVFEVADSADDGGPVVWRARVPDVSAASDAALVAETTRMDDLDARVASGRERAGALMRRRDAGLGLESVSFAVGGGGAALPAAEHALLAALEGGDSVSFSNDEGEDSPSKIEGFLDDLWRRATTAARVETCVGPNTVAISEVSILGDITTTLRAGASVDEVRVHDHSLTRALSTRRAWVRIVVQTLQVTALISTGNPFLALPGAWRFIKGIMAEVETLKAA